MQRRDFLAGAIATTWHLGMRDTTENVEIETRYGKVRGESGDGVRAFRGIPFAKPPVGPLRFHSPQPPEPWTGVRETLRFALAPIQTGHPAATTAEDCLYLNVWAPETPGPHPVLVWVHGGGNTGGWTGDPLTNGGVFARDGVVCVTLAYRLGALGFLQVDEFLGPEYAESGNNALLDLAAGLRWVQENIAAFGGDPNRVTFAGQSAGAKNVAALLGSPAAKGTFQQSILESGSGQTVHTREEAREIARLFVTALGVKDGTSKADTAKALIESTPAQLLAAQMRVGGKYPHAFPWRAVIGGDFLPKLPVDAVASGISKDVPLLLGTCRDESLLFFAPDAEKHPIAGREMAHLSVEAIHSQRLKYEAAFPAQSALDRRIRLVTAEEYWIPTIRMAEAHSKAGGRTWMYRFDHLQTSGAHAGYAPHGSELSFVWEHLPATAGPELHRLANTMHASWVSFVKDGKASVTGITDWPAYPGYHRDTLLFSDTGCRIEPDPFGEERRLWDGIL